jgi:hypothetical protein
MIPIKNCSRLPLALLLLALPLRQAHAQQRPEVFSIDAYSGEAKVVRSQGRAFVELEELARITKGSLRFEGNKIILALPSDGSSSSGNAEGFSRPFMKAAIETMASIREWGGMLIVTIQHGYPVEGAPTGYTIAAYQGRAADNVGLASAEAQNDSDRQGLELLRNEFNGMQTWSERFVEARRSSSAASLTTSPHALDDDADAQKLIRCGRFLAQMFASGAFQDDVACH